MAMPTMPASQLQGTRHFWFSDPEPLNAAVGAAGQALEVQQTPSGHSQQQRGSVRLNLAPPCKEDLHVLLPGAQHAAISRGSVHRDEADAATKRFVARLGIRSFDKYRRLGLDTADLLYSTSASAEILTSIAIVQSLAFFLDDLCFDMDDLPGYHGAGGGPVGPRNPDRVRHFLARTWSGMLRSPDPPHPSLSGPLYGPLEMAVWEVGRDLRRLSTPDWYHHFVQAAEGFAAANQSRRAGAAGAAALRDLESYVRWRVGTVGLPLTITQLEVANQCFLPPQVRAHPAMLRLMWAAGIAPALLNDIFSYAKEVDNCDRDYCPIRLLMRREGLPLPQALRRVVELTNSYHSAVGLAEADLPSEFRTDKAVRRFVLALKEICSGTLHFHEKVDRYRWPVDESVHL